MPAGQARKKPSNKVFSLNTLFSCSRYSRISRLSASFGRGQLFSLILLSCGKLPAYLGRRLACRAPLAKCAAQSAMTCLRSSKRSDRL